MVQAEISQCFDKTEQLLGELYKMIKSNPGNNELITIFERLLSIAKSQIEISVAVSNTYFSEDIKEYFSHWAERKEEELCSTDFSENNSRSNNYYGNNQYSEQMVQAEISQCFGKTEQLLGELYEKIKNNPENEELIMIFESILSIARSQIRISVAVSDSYFSKDMKDYFLQWAERKEEELCGIDLPKKNSRRNNN